jgi:cysteinyl-tRNA synthetase
MHNGYLQVEGRKMSKSEGNFVTIHDLLHTEKFGGRKWPGEVLRLAMLMTHYREPIDFSVRRLEEAEYLLRGWSDDLPEPPSSEFGGDVDPVFLSYVLNDLNIYPAINRLSELISGLLQEEGAGPATLMILGVSPWKYRAQIASQVFSDGLDEEAIIVRIDERLSLIREKNFAEADKIRDELLAQGIQLKDGKDLDTGERVTTWEVKR